jgi:hypothetical protein
MNANKHVVSSVLFLLPLISASSPFIPFPSKITAVNSLVTGTASEGGASIPITGFIYFYHNVSTGIYSTNQLVNVSLVPSLSEETWTFTTSTTLTAYLLQGTTCTAYAVPVPSCTGWTSSAPYTNSCSFTVNGNSISESLGATINSSGYLTQYTSTTTTTTSKGTTTFSVVATISTPGNSIPSAAHFVVPSTCP